MFVPQIRDAGGIEHEKPAIRRRQFQPACRENAEKVPVREESRISTGLQCFVDYGARTQADMLHAFAVRHAIAEQSPTGPNLADIGSGFSLIGAVIPLAQIFIDLRVRRKPAISHVRLALCMGLVRTRANRWPASLSRTLRAFSSPAAVSGRSVRGSVSARETPFGFAMPNQPEHLSYGRSSRVVPGTARLTYGLPRMVKRRGNSAHLVIPTRGEISMTIG